MEDHKLTDLLIKFEDKIDSFLQEKNINNDIAKEVRALIEEKIKILEKRT